MTLGSRSRKAIALRQGLSREVLRQALADLPVRLERHVLSSKIAGDPLFSDEEEAELYREHVRAKYPEAFGCIEDYIKQNRRSASLEKKFGDIAEMVLKVEPRLEEFRRVGIDFWDEFHREFPNLAGIVWVSAVGFSRDFCYAMISVSSGVGSLHSSGRTLLYRREGEEWTEVDVIAMWMS